MGDKSLRSRREFLGLGVGVLGAAGLAACGGTSTSSTSVAAEVPKELIDAAGSMKGSSMGLLSQKLYSTAANDALDASIKKFADATGTKVENSLVQADAGDVVAKIDAEVKGGVARDMAFMTDSRFIAQFHALGDLEDVTDVVTALTAKYGEPCAEAKNFCVFDGKWYAIPYHFIGIGSFLRKDWMQEKGITPKDVYTWEELRDVCLEISDPGKRRYGWGMTVNRSGDANGMIEALINSYGGSLASNDGKKVTFDSPETVQAVTFLGDIYTNSKYKSMLPPGVASWTDTSNNENWLAGVLGYTRNSFSVYADSKTKKNPVYEKTHVFSDCIGPATDSSLLLGQSQGFTIFKGAKNAPLAKILAQYLITAPALVGVSKEAPGLVMPAWEKVWDADPYFASGDPAFPMVRKLSQQPLPLKTKNGLEFPQKASAGQQAVVAAYVLTDMMQQVVQGAAPAQAVKSAHDKMVQIFNQQGLPQ
ncbi:extracellular solute-binding protein [Paractinoplanes brasiliensis]|uniref:Carbohydrate ABC transporter substrate-binding protein (CUT1 family) n=1 Tax=Paractinoplanes brasiliensis TaxID=52695 RepID=A0A4V3C7F6_9ACTN|nr:extracellular solute-binding protein [Actinoplanes brasiliensis]TDO37478.1 carbohydrate ABC transporter substrate-binding protein (CUT1 family) [Actinoplanes brasiliensis]GID29203.1 ABC transporter substrate-binding protein [Actinoplanes brasiliensis]